jgi:hypothetical protein
MIQGILIYKPQDFKWQMKQPCLLPASGLDTWHCHLIWL